MVKEFKSKREVREDQKMPCPKCGADLLDTQYVCPVCLKPIYKGETVVFDEKGREIHPSCQKVK